MATKIYVGNLPYVTKDEDLAELFQQHGAVASAKVVTYSRSGRSKGFGFVEIEDERAEDAVRSLHGLEYGGRPLRVEIATSTPAEASS